MQLIEIKQTHPQDPLVWTLAPSKLSRQRIKLYVSLSVRVFLDLENSGCDGFADHVHPIARTHLQPRVLDVPLDRARSNIDLHSDLLARQAECSQLQDFILTLREMWGVFGVLDDH